MSAVIVPPILNLQADCQALREAFKGIGCNEKKVIEILGHRNQGQRIDIAQAYYSQYGESLHKRLRSELSGKLEKAVLLWMMEPAERDAVLLYESMKGAGRKDRALISLVCTQTSGHLYLIKQAYYTMFNQTLENHIEGISKGEYQKTSWTFWRTPSAKKKDNQERLPTVTKLLLALVRGNRPETTQVDRHIALTDAHLLNKANDRRLASNEDTLVRILSTRSTAQLAATFNYFHQHYGHDFEKVLKREGSGFFEEALLAVVQCVRSPSQFFSQELYNAMEGMATDDDSLIRVITTRAETDMQYIKLEFAGQYKRSLDQMICAEISGNYRNFLLTLIGHGSLSLYSPRASR